MIKQVNKETIQDLLLEMEQTDNSNLRFAKAAHSLWIRFHNYEKNPPYVIYNDLNQIAAVCMITKLQREPYANLYEIFAVKPGYATDLYWEIMQHMHIMGVKRLKMSCTPSSIGWHMRNGIVGWAVDPSGSIRVDVPIMPTKQEQLDLRELAVIDPSVVMPPTKQANKLRLEENSFGPRKLPVVEKAIDAVGQYYLRRHLPWSEKE